MPFPPTVSPFPISGTDWADGRLGVGTPTPLALVIRNVSAYNNQTSGAFLEEEPDSPQIEVGEVTTIAHRFRCDYDTGVAIASALPRLTLLLDSTGLYSTVLNVSLNREKGNLAIVVITAEAILDPPPDEYSVTPIEFNLALEKHPRYQAVLWYNMHTSGPFIGQKIDDTDYAGFEIIQAIKQSTNAPQLVSQQESYYSILTPDNIAGYNDLAVTLQGALYGDGSTYGDLIQELLQRFWRGETEFYLSGYQIRHTIYYYGLGTIFPGYYSIPPMDQGGYVQDPVVSGFLPFYFWSLDGTFNTSDFNNALALLPVQDGLTLYNDPVSLKFKWLRQADEVSWQRVWFRHTRTWVGGPLGIWDSKVYPVWNNVTGGLEWS